MRINFYGNLCNSPYQLVKFLRKKGVDARIFIETDYKAHAQPENVDPELKNNYPEWITPIKPLKENISYLYYRKFIKELSDCDCVHVTHIGPYFAYRTGRPYIFQPVGWDLAEAPFLKGPKGRIIAHFQRIGIKNANKIILSYFSDYFLKSLSFLDLDWKKCAYLHFPVDTDLFKPYDTGTVKKLRLKYDHEFVFFSPSRHIWYPAGTSYSENKRNDRLVRAFAELVKRTGGKILLILIERGRDVSHTKRLVKELGVENQVTWLPSLNMKQLADYYNLSDLVFDQFDEDGVHGTVTTEALACGKQVFINLKDFTHQYKSQPPVINVLTEEEIFHKMLEFIQNPELIKRQSEIASRWVRQNIGWEEYTDKFIGLYEQVIHAAKHLTRQNRKSLSI